MKRNPLVYEFENYICAPDTGCVCEFWDGDSPLHMHQDFCEITLVTCGSFENTYNGKKEILERNHLIYFNVGEQHSVRALEKNSIMCNFLIEKSTFKKYISQSESLERLANQKIIVKKIQDVQTNYLTMLARNGMDNILAFQRKEIFNLYAINALTCLVLEAQEPVRNVDRYTEELKRRMDHFKYINYHVRDIYREFPVADSALCTRFHELTGQTVVQYNNGKKMEYAAQKLILGEYTITEISNKLNISSVSYFIRKFKEHFGVTPKEYQKSHTKIFYIDYNEFKKI